MKRLLISGTVLAGVIAGAAAQDRTTTGTRTTTADEERHVRACQENLAKLDGAKEQLALEYRLPNGADVTIINLLDPAATGKLGQGYLRAKPVCPSGGVYALNPIGKDPVCSHAPKGHVLPGGDAMPADAVTTAPAALAR